MCLAQAVRCTCDISSLRFGTFSLVVRVIVGAFDSLLYSSLIRNARIKSPASSAPDGHGTITRTRPSWSVVVSVPTCDRGLINWPSPSSLSFSCVASTSGFFGGWGLRSGSGLVPENCACLTASGEGGSFFCGGGWSV